MRKKRFKKIKAVLFDLGKVILHFDFAPAFRRLSKKTGLEPDEIGDFFKRSGLEVLYDGGKISSRQFHSRVKKGLGHDLDFDEFRAIWNRIFRPNREVVSLIRELKPRTRLVLVSNTNPMHFDYILKHYPVMGTFDKHVLSYKEKIRKPDERIYRTAMQACQARASEIFYIDDREDLTEAARHLGFNIFTYQNNPNDLLQRIKQLEILP